MPEETMQVEQPVEELAPEQVVDGSVEDAQAPEAAEQVEAGAEKKWAGMFETPEKLEEAYKSLQPEYTRATQTVSEYEKAFRQIIAQREAATAPQVDPVRAELEKYHDELVETGEFSDATVSILVNEKAKYLHLKNELTGIKQQIVGDKTVGVASSLVNAIKEEKVLENEDLAREVDNIFRDEYNVDFQKPESIKNLIDVSKMDNATAQQAIKKIARLVRLDAEDRIKSRGGGSKTHTPPKIMAASGGAPATPANTPRAQTTAAPFKSIYDALKAGAE